MTVACVVEVEQLNKKFLIYITIASLAGPSFSAERIDSRTAGTSIRPKILIFSDYTSFT